MPFPEIGAPAPPFSGAVQDGSTVSLADFAGRRVALYFYPKDDTSGCTKQACNLRDHFGALTDAGIAVVGVSKDSLRSHGKFADKYQLPFPLIADTEKSIQTDYGVLAEKSMYGRTYMGTLRTTFLIDADGVLRAIIEKPTTGDHAREILETFEAV